MKKFLVLALLCVATISVQAQKAETDDQKAVKKEMLEKYDANKDGKLDKEEKGQDDRRRQGEMGQGFPP